MKLTIRTFVAALLVATFALFGASPAFAQGPTLAADPVAAAGENTVTITGSGFPADLAGFMFPCADAGSAEEWIAAPTADVCDTGAVLAQAPSMAALATIAAITKFLLKFLASFATSVRPFMYRVHEYRPFF